MKFQVVSDIHMEVSNLDILNLLKPTESNLILDGDIGSPLKPEFKILFDYVSQNWTNIIYVAGNHEYYNDEGINMSEIDDIIKKLLDTYSNVYWLHDSSITINDITFVGSVLWSSPIVTGRIYPMYMDDQKLNDHIMGIINKQSIKYLEETIPNISGKVCAITHYMPLYSKDIPNPIYQNDELMERYFGNQLYELMSQVDVWISGHTHQRFRFSYKGTPWLCNPIGMPHENLGYEDMVVEL